MIRFRRFIAIVVQLGLLALPFSGGSPSGRHCDDLDHAPSTTMDMQCHSLPACTSTVMQAAASVRLEPVVLASVVADVASAAPLSVTQTPEPPPPRA